MIVGPTYTEQMIEAFVPPVPIAPAAATGDAVEDGPRPASGTGSTGGLEPPIEDGREEYMRDTVHAVGIELVGTTGAWPTADELFEVAWPQYSRKVDLSRPGRITAANAQNEMRAKCIAWARKAAAGGHGTLEAVVAGYQARKQSSTRHEAPGGQQASAQGGGPEAGAGGQGAQANRIVRLPLLYASEVTAAEPALDFVEGLLVEGGMSVWYGDSNVGKTFAVLDLAMHIALGRPYRGREVDQGGVVYCALEGVAGIRNRVAAWMRHHWVKPGERHDLPLAIVPSAINMLDTEADVPALIDAIAAAADQVRRPVKLVVLDTLSRALAGGNENSPEDMGALVRSSDLVRQACGGALAYVHHSGKDAARGARGHSLLRAATDTEVEITRAEGAEVSLIKVTKQRELEIGDDMGFRLEVIDLGQNRRGKPLTSCVAVEADAPAPVRRERKPAKSLTTILEALQNAIASHGVRVQQDGVPSDRLVVTVAQWRAEAYSKNISMGTDDSKRRAFDRCAKAMLDAKAAASRNQWVWLC